MLRLFLSDFLCAEVSGGGLALIHNKVCSRMKGASWSQRVKLVTVMIHQSKMMSANSTRRSVSPAVSNSDDAEDETNSENNTEEDENDIHPNKATTWEMSLSQSGRHQALPSSIPWLGSLASPPASVTEKWTLSSVGMFSPVHKEDQMTIKFQMFSSTGHLIHQQEEEELYPTDLARVGEMKPSRPVRLEATGGNSC